MITAIVLGFLLCKPSVGSGPMQRHKPTIKTAAQISPPIVDGPIYACASAVAVYGFAAGATVDVYANGAEHIGRIEAPLTWDTGEQSVLPLTRPLKIGDSITATQTVMGFTSSPSFAPVIVKAVPTDLDGWLTRPVVDSNMWECGQVVNVHNLKPSMHVDVIDVDTSAVIGSGESTSDNLSVVTTPLVRNRRISAIQTYCPGTAMARASDEALPQFVPAAPHPPGSVIVGSPVIPGGHILYLYGLAVGAALEAKLSGSVIAANKLATASGNKMTLPAALPAFVPLGQPTVTQALCEPSKPSNSPPAETALSAPHLWGPICPGDHIAYVSGVVPGATTYLMRGSSLIGVGSGSTLQLGGGMTWHAGDDLYVVQQEGFLTSAPSNHVFVGCGTGPNVVTQHNDNYRTGGYAAESKLTPLAVHIHGMRVKYHVNLEGRIRSQPLYVRNVHFGLDARLAMFRVVANSLFVCDTTNTVSAINADTGSFIWRTALVDTKLLRATGIESTPVIDVPTHRLYVVFSADNDSSVESADHTSLARDTQHEWQYSQAVKRSFWLVVLDYTTGKEVKRVKITGDRYASDGRLVSFQPIFQRQHASLLFDHGVIYVAFCAIPGEWTEYHGWVMAYDGLDLSRRGVWCSSKNYQATFQPGTHTYIDFPESNTPDDPDYSLQGGSGIWQGGGGLAADDEGSVYFLTGNGVADPNKDMYGDCFVRLSLSPSGLTPIAFVPSDHPQMFKGDGDLGSGGAMVIPDTNLAIGGGKPGLMYLVDRGSMAGLQQITAATSQYPAHAVRYRDAWAGPHLHGAPTYWRGPDPAFGYMYCWGEKDVLRQYQFDTSTERVKEPANRTASVKALDSSEFPFVMPGGMLSVSSLSNRRGSGILWATLPRTDLAINGPDAGESTWPGQLYAFDAETLEYLWDTSFSSTGRWITPTIADGKVFIATNDGLLIAYELGRGDNKKKLPTLPYHQQNHRNRMMSKEQVMDESMMPFPGHLMKSISPNKNFVRIATLFGDGVITYASTNTRKQLSRPIPVVSISVRGSYGKYGSVTMEPGSYSLQLSQGHFWKASDGSHADSVLEKTMSAPDNRDARWACYRLKNENGKGILMGRNYIVVAYTNGGAPNMNGKSRNDMVRIPLGCHLVLFGPNAKSSRVVRRAADKQRATR